MKNSTLRLSPLTTGLVVFVIIVHLVFFVLEAIFWMNPTVYSILLGFLDNPVNISYPIQALTLKGLFINQGFYNLFIAAGGLMGLRLVSRKNYLVGYSLILFLCFCGFGAGCVLACSTKGYILAFFQACPAAISFLMVFAKFKHIPNYQNV